jgi:glycosyltransferase involved in cell wall biosynthesis
MRVGQNPAKFVDYVVQPQKITVALLNYIPALSGYFTHSLDVLKVSLNSIYQHTGLPYDLLVFDNASAAEVRHFLIQEHDEGRIQYLILSEKNVGKGGAWNFIFGSAPGEYIAYADNDIYFNPGWLPTLINTLETVPQVGMVTGMPLLNPEEYSTSTIEWAERHPEASLQRGRLLPWEDYWRHAGSLGNTEDKARVFYDEHDSLQLTYADQTYYVGAGHFQFLARREVLQQALPIPSDRPMGQVRALDIAINRLGYLRLCTAQWHVRHLGNTLGEGKHLVSNARKHTFWRWQPVRRLLSFAHERTFDLLYKNRE